MHAACATTAHARPRGRSRRIPARASADPAAALCRLVRPAVVGVTPAPGAKCRWRRWLGALGPGVPTGAADDDPSGIATYSVVGAQYGTTLLWSALFTWPLMGAVDAVRARRHGHRHGLAGLCAPALPALAGGLIALALLVANTVNIAADLAGMADAMELLGAGPPTSTSGCSAWASARSPSACATTRSPAC